MGVDRDRPRALGTVYPVAVYAKGNSDFFNGLLGGTSIVEEQPIYEWSDITMREDDELRTIERKRLRSLVEGDLETAGLLHADDFQLIYPAGGSLSKEQYLGAIETGGLKYLVWEPEEIAVRRYGDAAALRYRAQIENVLEGKKQPLGQYWHTDVYERRDGNWQVVWSQATEIQSPK